MNQNLGVVTQIALLLSEYVPDMVTIVPIIPSDQTSGILRFGVLH